MIARNIKTYFFVPLIYIGVILGLLFFQFGKRAEKFFDSLNGLQVVGTKSPDPTDKRISELHIRYQGIDFPFGDRWKVELVTQAGNLLQVGLLDYTKHEKGFRLKFEQDVALDFSIDAKRNSLIVNGNRNLANLQPRSIVFRFAVVDGAKANSVERMPIISVKYKDKDFFLTLPRDSQIDMARQRLVINQEPAGSQLFTMAPASTGTKDSFRQWYANQSSSTTAEQYRRRLDEYVSGAYAGWKSGRYAPETGTWVTAKGTNEFQEPLLVALLSESIRRNEYGLLLEEAQKVAALHVDQLTFFSSVYLGDLLNWAAKLQQDDTAASSRLLEQIRKRDLSVFLSGNVIQFAADRASPPVWDELVRFSSEIDLQQVNLPVALGMLTSYYTASSIDPALLKQFDRFSSLINSIVFPGIVKLKEGFFLEWEPGRVDVAASIQAGRVLLLAGNAEKDEVLSSIGRDLILSSLGLSDKQGFLPQRILFSDQTFQGTEGKISPEQIYPWIQENPYYPRFISLSKELGRGNWLFIAADVSAISIQPQEYRFRFRFPVGAIHHFIFKGAKPYREIQIWGIPWRNDPRFERYPVGSFFLEDLGIFAVKYQHKKLEEEFLMRF
jgi:hypothetical protein